MRTGAGAGRGVDDVAGVHVVPPLLVLLDDEVLHALGVLQVEGGAVLVVQAGVDLQVVTAKLRYLLVV